MFVSLISLVLLASLTCLLVVPSMMGLGHLIEDRLGFSGEVADLVAGLLVMPASMAVALILAQGLIR